MAAVALDDRVSVYGILWVPRSEAARALVLDADGVVIHPWRFAHCLADVYGISREMTAPFFGSVFDECLLGHADLRSVLPPFLDEWGWPGSVDEFIALWLETEDAVDDRVIQVVRHVRVLGVVCCLATNQEPYRAAYMRAQMGLAREFDHLFFSCDLGCQKPDAAFYEAIEHALDLQGSQIVFWDDSARHVAAARNRGWIAGHYRGFDDSMPLWPDLE